MAGRAVAFARAHWSAFAAGVVILLAAALRVALVRAGWPGTDSDDATMGLMARHILLKGEHPIFFWGQAYMGSIEAYLGATMFAIFGISLAAMKFALIALYAAFLIILYLVLVQLFSPGWALFGLVLLALGGNPVLYLLLNAYGGYLETLLFGALLVLLVIWLIRLGAEGSAARWRLWRRWRLWGFAGWGLAAGLAIYSDPLVAPFVALGALALVLVFRRELLGRWGMLACLGFLLGVSPWLAYAVTAPSLDAAKSFLQHTPRQQTQTAVGAPSPVAVAGERVLGTVFVSIPNMTGGAGVCSLPQESAWPPDRWTMPSTRACIALRGLWGTGFLVLMALALAWEIAALRPLLRLQPEKWTAEQREAAARGIGRLIALGAPALTILFFAASSASATSPWIFARYLVTLLIALPVHLGILWERARASIRGIYRLGAYHVGIYRLATGALLLVVLAAEIVGTNATSAGIASQQATNRQQFDLVRALLARGDTRVASEFWTCYRTAFLSGERVICSVLNPQFQPQPNRYPPFDTLVKASPRLVFVFPVYTQQARSFNLLANQNGWHYATTTVDQEWQIFEVTNRA
jgi:hypothetical protein